MQVTVCRVTRTYITPRHFIASERGEFLSVGRNNKFDITLGTDGPRPLFPGCNLATSGAQARADFMTSLILEQTMFFVLKGKGLVVLTGCGHPRSVSLCFLIIHLSFSCGVSSALWFPLHCILHLSRPQPAIADLVCVTFHNLRIDAILELVKKLVNADVPLVSNTRTIISPHPHLAICSHHSCFTLLVSVSALRHCLLSVSLSYCFNIMPFYSCFCPTVRCVRRAALSCHLVARSALGRAGTDGHRHRHAGVGETGREPACACH